MANTTQKLTLKYLNEKIDNLPIYNFIDVSIYNNQHKYLNSKIDIVNTNIMALKKKVDSYEKTAKDVSVYLKNIKESTDTSTQLEAQNQRISNLETIVSQQSQALSNIHNSINQILNAQGTIINKIVENTSTYDNAIISLNERQNTVNNGFNILADKVLELFGDVSTIKASKPKQMDTLKSLLSDLTHIVETVK